MTEGSTKTPVRLASLLGLLLVPATTAAEELPTDKIRLPPGFRLEVFADDVANARQIAPGPGGLVFVGSREAGKVYAVRDRDGDGWAEQTSLIAEGLEMPSGVAYGGGALYVADVDLLLRYDAVASSSRARRPRRSSPTTSPRTATTAGAILPSVRTAGSICRSASPATSASARRPTAPSSP